MVGPQRSGSVPARDSAASTITRRSTWKKGEQCPHLRLDAFRYADAEPDERRLSHGY